MVQLLTRIGFERQKTKTMKPDSAHQPNKTRFRADRLADLMRTRGLTQGDLAKYMGVYPSQVSRWLTGVNIPNVDTLVIMADFFGVSADYLLDRIGDAALYGMPELSPDEWEFILSIRDGSFPDALRKLAEEMTKRESQSKEEGPDKGQVPGATPSTNR